jgi:hypothetical protein
MKRTKITYIKLSNNIIKIIKIENAANLEAITLELGTEKANFYLATVPNYYGESSIFNRQRIHIKTMTGNRVIHESNEYSTETFSTIIQAMKASGERLSAIRKTSLCESKPKEILI